MPRLPDIGALGPRPTPRAVPAIASYKAGIAEAAQADYAETLAGLGDSLFKAGEELGKAGHNAEKMRQDAAEHDARQQLLDAQTRFWRDQDKAVSPITLLAGPEAVAGSAPDLGFPPTREARADSLRRQADDAAQGIADADARNGFLADTMAEIDALLDREGGSRAIAATNARRGNFDSGLADNLAAAIGLADPAGRQALIANTGQRIALLVAQGDLSAEEGRQAGEQWRGNYAEQALSGLPARQQLALLRAVNGGAGGGGLGAMLDVEADDDVIFGGTGDDVLIGGGRGDLIRRILQGLSRDKKSAPKPDATPDLKPGSKLDVKPETKPDLKLESKPNLPAKPRLSERPGFSQASEYGAKLRQELNKRLGRDEGPKGDPIPASHFIETFQRVLDGVNAVRELFGHRPAKRVDIKLSDLGDDVEPQRAIQDFVTATLEGDLDPTGSEVRQLNLGKIDPSLAAKLKADTAGLVDISELNFAIATNNVGHAFNKHGPGNETDPTQEPISPESISTIIDVISNYDKVSMPREKGSGDTVTFEKRVNGRIFLVQQVRDGAGNFSFFDMWIKKN